jgi:hypothetical protein
MGWVSEIIRPTENRESFGLCQHPNKSYVSSFISNFYGVTTGYGGSIKVILAISLGIVIYLSIVTFKVQDVLIVARL